MLGATMIPGSPQANMYFTLYGYNTLDQARGLIRDLKMVRIILSERLLEISYRLQGQYTKLPPRVTFTVQALGAIIVSQINLCVAHSLFNSFGVGRTSELRHYESNYHKSP